MRFRGPVAPIMKTHPLTGEPIVPVGIVNEKVVWPILGGDASNDPDDDDQDDADDSGDGDHGGKEKANDDSDSGGDGETLSAEEVALLRRRMRAADKRAAEAERKIREAEQAKKDEATKATERAEEAEKKLQELQSRLGDLQLENAFLSTNKHSWHDADEALASAQRNGYLDDVVDEDGNVNKAVLAKALERLAKDKPFLVKPPEGKKDEQDDEPSGEPAGGRSDNLGDDRAKRAKLQRRFTVIR